MNKTVVITGASGGIGLAITKKFINQNYNVIAVYNKNHSELTKLESIYSNIKIIKADISEQSQVQKITEMALSEYGTIDILINNAGVALPQKVITEVSEYEYDLVFNTNVKGTFNCIKSILPYMIQKHDGNIINISSMWGLTGASCEVVYSASKAAIAVMTKALAKEVGPSNIRVNCVAPGVIDTKMNAHLSKDDKNTLCDETPLCRIGTPDEVSEAVYFLATDNSKFITGQILSVDGGFII